jgi:multidrug efflux pump subunit AcrA (membrane-fusion protein)
MAFVERPHRETMAFTVEEFLDLLRILEERPEWRAELRRLVLTDELLTLPELMRGLVEAQQRTEHRVTLIEERLAELIATQQATDERLAALVSAQQATEARLTALVSAQQATDERLAALADALHALTRRVDSMDRSVSGLHDDASRLKGYALETRYRSHAQVYFAPMARRLHVFGGEEFEVLLDGAVEQGQLLESEALDIILADLVLRGRRRDDNTRDLPRSRSVMDRGPL